MSEFYVLLLSYTQCVFLFFFCLFAFNFRLFYSFKKKQKRKTSSKLHVRCTHDYCRPVANIICLRVSFFLVELETWSQRLTVETIRWNFEVEITKWTRHTDRRKHIKQKVFIFFRKPKEFSLKKKYREYTVLSQRNIQGEEHKWYIRTTINRKFQPKPKIVSWWAFIIVILSIQFSFCLFVVVEFVLFLLTMCIVRLKCVSNWNILAYRMWFIWMWIETKHQQ